MINDKYKVCEIEQIYLIRFEYGCEWELKKKKGKKIKQSSILDRNFVPRWFLIKENLVCSLNS